MADKITKNNEPLSMNNIKIKDKIIENIVIDDIIIKNSNNNIVKFNISLSNNTISFKNCTDKFEEKKEGNNYLDRFKIIFKTGIKDNNIIYQIDKIKENWDF